MKKTTKIYLSVLVVVIFAVAAVLLLRMKSTATTQNAPDKVSLRLKWINQAQFAGYYMANKDGRYSDKNLDVTINPAGPNISPVQLVSSGADDFGVAGADEVLVARSQGVPLVAIGVIFKQNPISLVSLKSANILNPKDLVGKKVGVIYGNDENLYRNFLKKEGIDSSDLEEVAAIPGVSQLLSGQVDVKMAYSMNDPVLLKIQGKQTNVMTLKDYGVDFYGDTLFTTEKMIKEHPERVRNFVQASIKGWNDAISAPDNAVAEIMRISPTLDKKAQLGYLQGISPIIQSHGDIGVSDPKIWANMQSVLTEQGVIKKQTDITKTFTNEFVQ